MNAHIIRKSDLTDTLDVAFDCVFFSLRKRGPFIQIVDIIRSFVELKHLSPMHGIILLFLVGNSLNYLFILTQLVPNSGVLTIVVYLGEVCITFSINFSLLFLQFLQVKVFEF